MGRRQLNGHTEGFVSLEVLSSDGFVVVPVVPVVAGVLSSAGFGVVTVGVLSSVGLGVVAVGVLSSVDFPVAGCSLPQLLQKRALAGSITPQFTHFFV
jgi:hypothetical protein